MENEAQLAGRPDVIVSEQGGKKPLARQSCERCRKSKLKCVPEPSNPQQGCQRCVSSGRECVFQTRVQKRRRKRTDARVTSLETELGKFRAIFDQLQQSRVGVQSPEALPPVQETQNRTTTSPTPSPLRQEEPVPIPRHSATFNRPPLSNNSNTEFYGCISEDTAIQLFDNFRYNCLSLYPILDFSEEESYYTLKRNRPLLLLAAVTAASSAQEPHTFKDLHAYLVREVTESAIIGGQRSVDLIQAILILETWYYPPDDLRKLNFYQWIHIAGTMAMQLGLGGQTLHQVHDIRVKSAQHMNQLRVIFAVYESCSSVAVSLHRHRMLSFPTHAHGFLAAFESHTAKMNDKRLVAWLRLQLLAEDVEAANAVLLSPNNRIESVDFGSLYELRDRFDQWERDLAPGLANVSLKIQFYYSRAKLYELVVFAFQVVDDLEPPYLTTQMSPASASGTHQINPPYIRAVISLVDSCKRLIQLFSDSTVTEMRGCPTITFVRALYAVKVLSIIWRLIKQPHSPISKIVDEGSVRTPFFIQLLTTALEAISGEQQCRVPFMIKSLVERIADSHGLTLSRKLYQQGSSMHDTLASAIKTNGFPTPDTIEVERQLSLVEGSHKGDFELLNSWGQSLPPTTNPEMEQDNTLDSISLVNAFRSGVSDPSDLEDMLMPLAFMDGLAGSFDFDDLDFSVQQDMEACEL